jgi:hypothetical protein
MVKTPLRLAGKPGSASDYVSIIVFDTDSLTSRL